MTLKLSNKQAGLCVVCDAKLPKADKSICERCNQPCELTRPRKVEEQIYEVKSMCCGADIRLSHNITCSDKCHQVMVEEMIGMYGEEKRVLDMVSGIYHRVPTKYIIEHGLKREELRKFPVWDEKK